MNEYLTTTEVCEVADLPQQTLIEWIGKGIVVPAIEGTVGRGNPHKFTVTQVVGILVAKEQRDSERGCVLSYVRLVVEAFGNVSEEWLAERLKKDGQYFVGPHQKKPMLQGNTIARIWPNAAKAYQHVTKHVRRNTKTNRALTSQAS